MKVLTLPDLLNSIEVFTSNGTTSVILLGVDIAASGVVSSVTALPGSGITVDNTDPANPKISNAGVIDVSVVAPLLVITAAPHVQLGIDTTQLGGTGARANKGMTASVTTADGQLTCATAVAFTPASSSANGGYVAAALNGVLMRVGDGTKVGVECYFSGDGGTTARAMKSIIAGDLLYLNGSIAGFQTAATDRWSFFYNVTS